MIPEPENIPLPHGGNIEIENPDAPVNMDQSIMPPPKVVDVYPESTPTPQGE